MSTPEPTSPTEESTDQTVANHAPHGQPGQLQSGARLAGTRLGLRKHAMRPGAVTVAQLLAIHRPRVKPLPSSAATLKPAVA